MKKIFSLLFPLAILTSGCEYEELQNKQLDSQDVRIFTASFEQSETRTYVENGSLLRWNAGDQISLFDGNTLNRQYQFDGETGDNAGTFSIVNKPFGTGNDLNCHYAVYPYASDVKITESGVITATLPADQNYAENSFGLGANTMVAVTKDIDDTYLKFKNVGGYLKLQLYGENVTVKSITLTGNDNEKLAGKATVIPAYEQAPTLAMSDDATTSITLDCGEGVKVGATEETATAFWIVVPPTTFEEGLTITVTEVDGESFTKSTSNAVVVERNIIKPMAAFEVEIGKIPNNQIWYTSSDGKVVTPYVTDVFGANIVSNIYEAGKGIITFDGDVTQIGKEAFYKCEMLTNITIPYSVTTIGRQAFGGSGLTCIRIPNSVSKIEERAFYCCYDLEKFTGKYAEDNGICLIVDGVFINFAYACGTTEYSIPNDVTRIGDAAFQGCDALITVIIPDSVTSIGMQAFWMCDGLTELVIPQNVNKVHAWAFFGCHNLKNVYCKPTLPPSITYSNLLTWVAFSSQASGRKIYVPMESVEAYKSAEGWSEYADDFVGYDF